MLRLLLLLHRYCGIVLCLLVAAWTLSGFVMMYVRYPSFSSEARLAAQVPLSFAGCCNLAAARDAAGDVAIEDFSIEMLADQPVLRLDTASGPFSVDLQSGTVIESVPRRTAEQVATTFSRSQSPSGTVRLLGLIDHDQWTVAQSADARPLYKFAMDDAAGTEFYVSASSGAIVQRTTARQRLWNYFGAVTHWIYPTLLRGRVQAWSQLVIWSSVFSLLLVVTGLCVGWMQWHPGGGRGSPYRGVSLWHHYAGLISGLLALAWIGSGLLSMNPWGLLEPGSSELERAQLAGMQLRSGQAIDVVQRLMESGPAADVRQVRSAPFAGQLFLIEHGPLHDMRVDAATLQPASLSVAALEAVAARLQPGAPVRSAGLIAAGDNYYYAHHFVPPFPAFRVVLADAGAARYYIDPRDGSLLRKLDRNGRWWRWLFSAPHQWDFAPALRRRPVWDIVVIALLAGLAAPALTGVWLGIRYLRRLAIISR